MVIATGWALAVAIPVFIFGPTSGAHFNPAVTIANAAIGNFAWADVPMYLIAQMIGAIIGACLVYLYYLPHWKETKDKGAKLGCFATGPAIPSTLGNFISEFIGTFVLWVIGLTLGGPTGYAINPARDLGPRIAHALLPIPDKGDSNWKYAWIPVVAPIAGGVVAALIFAAIF